MNSVNCDHGVVTLNHGNYA